MIQFFKEHVKLFRFGGKVVQGSGHAELGMVEVVAPVPFEEGFDASADDSGTDLFRASVHLAHQRMSGVAFPVSEGEVHLLQSWRGSIVPDEVRESRVPH